MPETRIYYSSELLPRQARTVRVRAASISSHRNGAMPDASPPRRNRPRNSSAAYRGRSSSAPIRRGKDAEAFPRNAVARLDSAGRGWILLLRNTCHAVRVPNRGGFVVGECDCLVRETSGRRYCALDRLGGPRETLSSPRVKESRPACALFPQ